MQVLLLQPHPSRGRGLQRLGALVHRAWTEAGAHVVAVAAPSMVSRHVPWKGAGRGLAAMESAAWFGQQLHKHVEDADLVVVVDPRDAVYTSPISGRVPVCVICHDLSGLMAAVGERSSRRAGAVDRLKAPFVVKALQRADHVLCTSEAAARAVRRLTEHAPAVLHPPVDEAVVPHAAHIRPRLAPPWPYLLCVDSGGHQSRRDALITTWMNLRRTRALDGTSLVLVGPPLAAEELSRVNACGGHVEVLQDVSDEHLGALYAGARALLALGGSGGFAWPIAEAHAAGLPVLAADGDDYEEVGADGCLYLPPEGVNRFDQAAWESIAEDLMSTGLLARARANGRRFEWRLFAQRLPSASVPVRIALAAAFAAADAQPDADACRQALVADAGASDSLVDGTFDGTFDVQPANLVVDLRDDVRPSFVEHPGELVDGLLDLAGTSPTDAVDHWLRLDHAGLSRHLPEPDTTIIDLRRPGTQRVRTRRRPDVVADEGALDRFFGGSDDVVGGVHAASAPDAADLVDVAPDAGLVVEPDPERDGDWALMWDDELDGEGGGQSSALDATVVPISQGRRRSSIGQPDRPSLERPPVPRGRRERVPR